MMFDPTPATLLYWIIDCRMRPDELVESLLHGRTSVRQPVSP